MPSKFVPFALAILFVIKLKFFRNKNIYEFIQKKIKIDLGSFEQKSELLKS